MNIFGFVPDLKEKISSKIDVFVSEFLDSSSLFKFSAGIFITGAIITAYASTPSIKEIGATLMAAGVTLGISSHLFDESFRGKDNKIHSIAISSKEGNKPRSMLAIRTADINSGGISSDYIIESFRQFGKTHSIDLVQEGTEEAFMQKMSSHANELYDTILLHGHGISEAIFLSKNYTIRKTNSDFFSWVNDHLKPGGKVILMSCSTAKGEDNIAKAISLSCPGHLVYAPEEKLWVLHPYLQYEQHDDDFDPIFLSFDPDKHNILKIYRNGELVIIPRRPQKQEPITGSSSAL